VNGDSALNELRAGVDDAMKAHLAAQARLAQAQGALERIRATGVGDAAAARAERESAAAQASASAGSFDRARSALDAALKDHIGSISTLQAIAPASVPIALLPVGLETRFAGDTLLIRVLPDEIHVEDFEPELADSEVEAGRTFWRQVWRGGTAEPAATEAEREAWVRLVQAIGNSRRASWVADQNLPIGGLRPAAPVSADAELPDPPTFGEPPRRAGPWSRPAVTRTLPDYFVAVAYQRSGRGGQASWRELARAAGKPVSDSIQLGPDPSAPPPTLDDSGPALPDGMSWMVDPNEAEAAGLLIRLPLPANTDRVDRLVVLGVLASLDPPAGSARLGDVLRNHHYSRGLEVLRIATPTNNTSASGSGYSKAEDPIASFAVERRTPAPPEGSDGSLLAGAFGLAAESLRGVANSGDIEQAAAGQMNALIWPSALGYWFESLAQPGPTDRLIADIRRHAVQMVRGRGPLPPLRIGRQPYAVLPVTSLRSWRPGSEPAGVVQVAKLLQLALPWWLDGVDEAPIVRSGENPDQGILDVLAQSPVSSAVAVRSMVGADVCYVPYAIVPGLESPATEANRQRWLALLASRSLGIKGLPYIGQLVAAADPVPLLRLPYTVDPRTPKDQAAAAWEAITAYLRALRGRTTADLRAENPRGFTSLLTLLAKRSVMLERVRAGVVDTMGSAAGRFVEAHLNLDTAAVVRSQMISTTATLRIGEARSVAGAFLAGSVKEEDGSTRSTIDDLDRKLVSGPLDTVRYAAYSETLQAAEAVASLTPERAALLLGEALDVASYRFDAWATSLATRRLSDLRAATPSGVTLGAYGIVEDIARRAPRPEVVQPPADAPMPLFVDAADGGYIHAPSLAHAATAAVLRAGHLSHAVGDANAGALAIDLSSSRVRTALGLLDGVRQGQPLGALLGYRTERWLHERGADVAVEVVRRLAPPPVVTATGTPEGLPPSAVCDGLALSRLPRQEVQDALAGLDQALGQKVDQVLDMLLDAVDSVADLLLAESVHQIVRGNPMRAAGALDVLNRGEGGNAEPEVTATPRTGSSITNRALVLVGHHPPAAPGWPIDGVRARAEPRLAAWAGHLLGDPDGISVVVQADGASETISLAELGLGALDLVFENLAARVLRHARTRGAGEGASIDLSEKRLAALLAAAEDLRVLITRARAGTGLDLARPQDRGAVVSGPPPPEGSDAEAERFTTRLPDADAGERRARLDAARASLGQAVAALTDIAPDGPAPSESTISEALDSLACFGLAPGDDPSRTPTASALSALHAAAVKRLEESTAAPDDASALFGEGFPVLALASPPFPAALVDALAADPVAAVPPELLAPLGGEAGALENWVEQYGRVRPGIGRLADALLAAKLRRTGASLRLRAIQQPPEPFPEADAARRGQWVGLRFPSPLDPNPVTNIVAHVLGDLDAERGMAVLAVDEFVEVIPSKQTTTGLSFAFDAPSARPPQAILLAVPPAPGVAWTIDSVAEVIGETVDLAKIRMVDLSSVAWAGRFLPALYLTDGDVSSGLDLPMRDLVKLAHARAEGLAQQ
jgi:hypothetical protein